MGIRGWLIAGAIAYALLKAKNPTWYEDLMLRGYAADQVPPPTTATDPETKKKFEMAATVAQAVGLPIGWILEIAQKVSPSDLPLIAAKIAAKVKSLGPPSDTTAATLAAYKAAAMAAGGVA